MVRLTDRPVMTLDVYRGHKTTIQQQQQFTMFVEFSVFISAGNVVSINTSTDKKNNSETSKTRRPIKVSVFLFLFFDANMPWY